MQSLRIYSRPPLAEPGTYPLYLTIGRRGQGKSALMERYLTLYWELPDTVCCDWNSSGDWESLQYVVPSDKKDENGKPLGKGYPMLLILPEYYDLVINEPKPITLPDGRVIDGVKSVPDTTPLVEILRLAHDERRVIVFTIHFYQPEQQGQKVFANLINQWPVAFRALPKSWNYFIGIRELSEVSSGKTKSYQGKAETETKRTLARFVRQARHYKTIIFGDVQNPRSISPDLWEMEDFIFLKQMNPIHLPDSLQHIPRYIEADRLYRSREVMGQRYVSLNRLAKNSYYCQWPNGNLTLEHSSLPLFRHHLEDDDPQALAGIQLVDTRGKQPDEPIQSSMDRSQERQERQLARASQVMEWLKDRDAGMTWKAIAEKYGVTESKVKTTCFRFQNQGK